jgi:hypothetical protein
LQAFAGRGIAAAEETAAVVGGDVFARDFSLADETAREASGATAFGGGAAEDEGVAAVLDDGLRFGVTVGARDLSDGLEAEDAAAAESRLPPREAALFEPQ